MKDSTFNRAFPIQWTDNHGNINGYDGMSLRDWFAGQALSSVLAIHFELAKHGIFKDDKHTVENAANRAYTIADAMLKEREK